ncbi:hypothetical protein BGX38DRAFT_262241 [Terfezia claveryi]|nr:hypothetical protein BGX38DRAFT_262241 [Terfezia claveryi]
MRLGFRGCLNTGLDYLVSRSFITDTVSILTEQCDAGPADDETQNDLENDHEAERDNSGEVDDQGDGELVVLQDEGDWDLAQVLDPGVPMEEGRDPTLVTSLTTSDPVDYPLPHPDLLSLHAAVMRVARAAGATAFEEDELLWSDEDELEQGRDGTSTNENF